MKEPGYVYILTNPSFKEDWVKIGKSSRPVDIRSKELDNTAVPLPFEIYATLKTVKYFKLKIIKPWEVTDFSATGARERPINRGLNGEIVTSHGERTRIS